MRISARILGVHLFDFEFATDEPEPQIVSLAGLPISERHLEEILADESEEGDRKKFGF